MIIQWTCLMGSLSQLPSLCFFTSDNSLANWSSFILIPASIFFFWYSWTFLISRSCKESVLSSSTTTWASLFIFYNPTFYQIKCQLSFCGIFYILVCCFYCRWFRAIWFLLFFVLLKATCFAKYLIELLPIKYTQPRYFNKLGYRIHRNI